jgi:hypothetical protein
MAKVLLRKGDAMARPVSLEGPVKNLSVQLLADEYDALHRAAQEQDVSKAAIVRKALRKELGLDKQKKQKKQKG